MQERRADKPAALDLDCAAAPAPRATRLALHVADRLRDGYLVRASDLAHHVRLGHREEDAHALGRAKREVEASNCAVRDRPTQPLARARIAALQKSNDAPLAYL